MSVQILQPRNIEKFERDSTWFYENIDLLRKNGLSGKFVAIKEKKIIASNEKLETVINILEEKGENPAFLSIEFVYPDNTVVLL